MNLRELEKELEATTPYHRTSSGGMSRDLTLNHVFEGACGKGLHEDCPIVAVFTRGTSTTAITWYWHSCTCDCHKEEEE